MNISKHEQRVLHALAQGGLIEFIRAQNGRVVAVECVTREGWKLDGCSLRVFRRLRRMRWIRSRSGGPYRITRDGLAAVRPQLDNR